MIFHKQIVLNLKQNIARFRKCLCSFDDTSNVSCSLFFKLFSKYITNLKIHLRLNFQHTCFNWLVIALVWPNLEAKRSCPKYVSYRSLLLSGKPMKRLFNLKQTTYEQFDKLKFCTFQGKQTKKNKF